MVMAKHGNNDIVLLLTACIDPTQSKNNIYHVLNDVDVRLNHYIEAIQYFLDKTSLRICFVDNSGYDLSAIERIKKYNKTGRLEFLSFLSDPETRAKGKGPGEVDIIKYAVENSRFISNSEYIIKITGRIKVRNIKSIIKTARYACKDKCKFVIAEKLYNSCWVHSYLFIAHKTFFNKSFYDEMSLICESEQNMVTFEQRLYFAIREWNNSGGKYLNFVTPIKVDGIRGDGGVYKTGSIKSRIKCILNCVICSMNKHIIP